MAALQRTCMAETQSSDVTLTVAKLAALFSSLTAGLYTAMQIESAPVIDLFLSGAPLVAVILWLEKDVTRTGVGAVQDFDYFLLLAWPVVIPGMSSRRAGATAGHCFVA